MEELAMPIAGDARPDSRLKTVLTLAAHQYQTRHSPWQPEPKRESAEAPSDLSRWSSGPRWNDETQRVWERGRGDPIAYGTEAARSDPAPRREPCLDEAQTGCMARGEETTGDCG